MSPCPHCLGANACPGGKGTPIQQTTLAYDNTLLGSINMLSGTKELYFGVAAAT